MNEEKKEHEEVEEVPLDQPTTTEEEGDEPAPKDKPKDKPGNPS